MNDNERGLNLCLLIALVGTCAVSTASMSDVIHLRGSIIEPACHAELSRDQTLGFQGCPSISKSTVIEVERVRHVTGAAATNDSSVRASLIKNGGHPSTEYDHEYMLLDTAGGTIRTGSYVVTINYP